MGFSYCRDMGRYGLPIKRIKKSTALFGNMLCMIWILNFALFKLILIQGRGRGGSVSLYG